MERVAETLVVVRLTVLSADAETSSRASIMVESWFISKRLSGGFQTGKSTPGFQKSSISGQNGVFLDN
jgi:hypothetical protein